MPDGLGNERRRGGFGSNGAGRGVGAEKDQCLLGLRADSGVFHSDGRGAVRARPARSRLPVFWAYLAIFAVVFFVSFAILDPDLMRERMRPGGQKPPRALWLFSFVLFVALDRRRPRPRPLPLERQRTGMAPDRGPDRAGGRLRTLPLGDAGEPVFLLGHPHPERPRPDRHLDRPIRCRPPSGLYGRDRHHRGERPRARLLARRGARGRPHACRFCCSGPSGRTAC